MVFLLTLIITLLSAAFIPQIIIDTDPENMLPQDQSERIYHNKIKQEFQLHDSIVVGAVNTKAGIFNTESLQALHQLSSGISQIEGVIEPDLLALATVDNISQGKQGELRFEWMMKRAPETQQGAERINQQIARLPLLQNTLASEDDKASAIYVPIKDKNESYRIATEIEALISELETEDDYYITGLPVAEDTFGYQMFVQMGISAPLAALMIFALMWLYFRNFKFIAAPMIVAMATVIIIMGLMIGMGFTVHIMSSMIPIFLMPIAVVDSIHIMSEFSDNYQQEKNRVAVIKQTINHLYKPMLFTSVTSALGFASLMLTPIPPVQVFGAFVALGIFLAFLLTIIFIPAYLSVLKPSSLESLQALSVKSAANKGLNKLVRFSLQHSKWLLLLFVGLVTVSIFGLSKIQINDNPVRWFKQDHPIRVSDKILNQHFAGTYDAYLVLEFDSKKIAQELNQIKRQHNFAEQKSEMTEGVALGTQINQVLITLEDKLFESEGGQQLALEESIEKLEQLASRLSYFQRPEALQLIEQLQQKLVESGLVGKSNSLADAVKTVNRELHSGQQKDYQLPNSQAGVAQALLQYQSSHRPHDLWHISSKDYAKTNIWLQLTSGDNQDMSKIVAYVDEYFKAKPLPKELSARWAGKTYLNKVWQDEMVAGMLGSLLSAFVVVLIMMVLLFRSVTFGVLAMLPLSITILAIYGLIGWIGKDYDMPIAVLSALTLGLSVDFAIHFLQRARDIYAQTKNFDKTMELMFQEPANAIKRNAVVIALGFTPLLLAPLMPYVTVGFFLATIMAVSALVTLVLLPIALKISEKRILK